MQFAARLVSSLRQLSALAFIDPSLLPPRRPGGAHHLAALPHAQPGCERGDAAAGDEAEQGQGAGQEAQEQGKRPCVVLRPLSCPVLSLHARCTSVLAPQQALFQPEPAPPVVVLQS